jgi:molybdate transport system ATP-binding protein
MNSTDGIISVRYSGMLGGFKLDVAFETPARGITAPFGPSGCGKTTILRCVAGLNRLPGYLLVGNEVWQDDASGKSLEPHERPVGYVFQEASLFAHLSVSGNLLYGQRRASKKGAAKRFRFDEVVQQLGIEHLLNRSTGELSGGERQRVALGRAFLTQPRLFLMDEPLSALDRMTKEEILPYFEALRASTSVPTLYVSHDISEIERLADHMVLLKAGQLVAAGPLNDLLADPRLPLARSPEASTVLEARVGVYSVEDGLTALNCPPSALMRQIGRIEEGSVSGSS